MSDAGGAPDRAGSIGGYLARQRKLRGISIDELCERTKIPRRNLERLEAGAFDERPDGFARGFVRTVALALGLDADEAVMRLMAEPDDVDEPADAVSIRDRLLRFAGVAIAVGAALALWSLGSFLLADRGGPEPPVESELVVRRDAVRRLAERVGVSEEPPAAAEPAPAADAP